MTWDPDKPHVFDPTYTTKLALWCICGRHKNHPIHNV